MNEEGLQVKISADTTDYEVATDRIVDKTSSMAGKIVKIIAGLALIDFMKDTAEVFKESARQVALFESAMEQMEVPQRLSDSLREFADAAQEAFGIDNDAILGAIANLTRLTGSAEAVDKLKMAMLDMSVATGQSVESVSKILSRAMTNGLTVLKRYGITATEEQQKMWDSFGDDMNAKAEFLNEIMESKFGGAAKKFGDSAAGAAERAKFAFEDMKKVIGASVLPILTGLLNMILWITTAVGGLTNMITILGAAWLAFSVIQTMIALKNGKEVDGLIVKYLALGVAKLWAINPILGVVGGAAMLAGIIALIYGIGAAIAAIPMPTVTGGLETDTKEAIGSNKEKEDNDKDSNEIINNITIEQDAMGDYNARTRNINGTQTNVYGNRR